MSENRGIFSLEEFYDLQVSGETTNIFNTFRYVNSLAVPATPGGPAYGYLASGYTGTPYSTRVTTVDRIDYGNDTATAATKGPVPTAKSWGDAAGNTSYGYAGGGNPDGSKIDRVDYSNDTPTASPKGLLSQARYYLSGAGNADYGYWAGGAGGEYSTIDRKDYASDTTTNSVKGTLTVGKRLFSSGTGNLSYGYFGGGATGNGGPYVSTIERVDYSNDGVTASPKGPLTSTRGYSLATGNGSYGYWGGASPADPSPNLSSIDRVDYSNDTATAETKSKFSTGNFGYGAATGSADYGYFMGGSPQPSGGSNIHRLDYANDTADTVLKGNLSSVRTSTLGAFSGQAEGLSSGVTPIVPATRTESGATTPVGTDYGYWGGGNSPPQTTIDRVDFSNDTATAAVKGPLSLGRRFLTATGSTSHGYFAGGASPSHVSTVERIDYGNDTATAVVKGPLSSARTNSTGATGNASYGYFSGGYPGLSIVDRIDFSNDTATAALKGNLSKEQEAGYATGNQSYGWFAGGGGGGPALTTVSRVDYSNDTATGSPRGDLAQGRKWGGATGNADYGYFGAGQPSVTSVDRIDYSNDTATASLKGPLTVYNYGYGATGNTSYGYFGGIASGRTRVDRIDFSNDSPTATTKGPLSAGRYGLTATSSRANANPTSITPSVTVDKGADGYTTSSSGPAMGYTLGGALPYSFSDVQRIDYSNDTATASPKGPLTAGTSYHAGVSSKDHGYSMGGKTPSNSKSTKVDRIDYGNDTATAASKGPLNIGAYRCYAGIGNKDYGYHPGGDSASGSPFSTHIQRIEYASDTSTATPKGNLAAARYLHSGTGNLSYGYAAIGGSSPFQNNSVVQRIEYANDTATAVIKGNLNQGSRKNTATGNADYGYVGGGTNPDLSQITRIDYSNDTATSVAKGPLTIPRQSFSSSSAPGLGYFYAGRQPSPWQLVTSVDRMDYSSDTSTAVSKGPLAATRGYYSAVSSRDIGGSLGTPPTYIPRIRWVDSAAENPGAPGPIGPAYGYVTGGDGKTFNQRIDYSNDTATASLRGNFSTQVEMGGAAGNLSYGYTMGGSPGLSRVNRIDYSNDTGTPTTKGPLSAGRKYCDSVGNTTYGYTGGGYPLGSIIDRLDYANDTNTATSLGNIFSPGDRSYATAGNLYFGYFAGGGGNYPRVSTVSRLDYANDGVATSPKGPLIGVLDNGATSGAGTGNQNFGYFQTNSGYQTTTQVSRVDYANDTATALSKGPLTANCYMRSATGSSNFGYFSGGYQWPVFGFSTIDRIDYSNDTATASVKGPLNTGTRRTAGVSSQIVASFAPTRILAPVQPPFPFPVQLPAPAPAYGYYTSGRENGSPSPATSKIDRIDFSNDTATTVLKGNMHTGRNRHTSLANQTHGYTGGGSNPAEASPAYLSSIERMTFANDTATSVDKSTFRAAFTNSPSPGQGANFAVSIGGPAYGYWQGANNTYVDRLDYSNDTAQAAATTNSTIPSNARSALSNTSYGYFCGGWVNKSVVDRLDYANDSTTMSPKGNLAAAVSHNFGIGNGNYGYIVAGRNTGFPSDRSDVQRIDFADDTATSSPKGPLAGTTYNGAGTGDASYGYVVQAQVNAPSFGYYTTIFRIDYSNDTATAAARGTFSWPGSQMRGISGRAYGLPN